MEETTSTQTHSHDSPFDSEHVFVIAPMESWKPLRIGELWAYRDLFWFLILRDIKVLYKQTVLGVGWAVVRPIFSTLVFTVIFGVLAAIPSDGIPYPVFAFAALLPWTYFSSALTGATESLISNSHLITKVYFPRLLIPLTPIVAKLLDFAISLILLLVICLAYGILPTLAWFWLPLLIAIMMLSATGIGLWLAALTIQFRDVRHGMQFLMQLLMYSAPVVWPLSLIPEVYRPLYGLYPMAGVIEGFRASVTGATPMPWSLIAIGTATSLILAWSGAFYFRRMERVFADVA